MNNQWQIQWTIRWRAEEAWGTGKTQGDFFEMFLDIQGIWWGFTRKKQGFPFLARTGARTYKVLVVIFGAIPVLLSLPPEG